jgi:hypothetical protein
VARLQGVYGSMAAGFAAKGLDTAFIADMAAWFQGANAGAPGEAWGVWVLVCGYACEGQGGGGGL